jgi:NADP-dependent 3-hydroxy acid dehydrogenase YdfG
MEKGLVIITGASSGIGAAIAKLFKEKGYPLLLLARREEKLIKGDRVLCKKVDVTNLKAFKSAVEEAEAKFGPVNCLINNAAVLYLGLFHEQNLEEIKNTLDVNVMGVANGMHLVLPGMIKRKNGTIFNICSVGGHDAFPTQAAYCASKFAVRALTDSVRKEVSNYNIRLMSVSPGAVETEVGSQTTHKNLKTAFDAMRKQANPLDPTVIAQAILYAYEQPIHVCIRELIIAPTPNVTGE